MNNNNINIYLASALVSGLSVSGNTVNNINPGPANKSTTATANETVSSGNVKSQYGSEQVMRAMKQQQ